MNIIFDFCLHILFLSILPTITKIRCGNLKEYARFGVEFELVLLILYFGVVFISFLLDFHNVLFLQAFATVVEGQKFQHIPVWHSFSVSGFSLQTEIDKFFFWFVSIRFLPIFKFFVANIFSLLYIFFCNCRKLLSVIRYFPKI